MDVMRDLLFIKKKFCRAFREKLESTKNDALLHSVKSKKWGIGIQTTNVRHPLDINSVPGRNIFGKLLSEIRASPVNVTTASMGISNNHIITNHQSAANSKK